MRKWGDKEGGSRSSPWDMSCPRKLFLDKRKSVFRDVRMQANLSLMFERKAKISCNGGRSVTKNLRAKQDCMRTSRKTDFHQKIETSAGLKITFMDMTYPRHHTELSTLSRHFLLTCMPIVFFSFFRWQC